MNLPPSRSSTMGHLTSIVQVWIDSIRYFVAACCDVVGLIWLSIAISLVPAVGGLWLMPSALRLAASNADRNRALVQRITGTPVESRRQPITGTPGFASVRHTWQRLKDPVVQRDLVWQLLNPVVGLWLSVLPITMVVYAAMNLIMFPIQLFADAEGPATWLLLFESAGLGGIRIPLALAVTGAELVLGIVLTRPLHATMNKWARFVLETPDTGQWKQRAEELATTRSDALDFQQAELERIERNLHDGAQMRFVSTGLTIAEASRLVREDPDRAIALLDQAKSESAAGLSELRSLVRGIRPPILSDRGLTEALRALARTSAIPTTLSGSLPSQLPAPLETALYFAVAEALTNAVKHSGARSISIELHDLPDRARICVIDDGCGGAETLTYNGGLAGVRRRLATFDGQVEVASPIGGPTVATFTVPTGGAR